MIPAMIGCIVSETNVGNTYSGSASPGINILPINPSKLEPIMTTTTQNIAISEACLIVLSSFADKNRCTICGWPGSPIPNPTNPIIIPNAAAPVAPPAEESKIGSMEYSVLKKSQIRPIQK